MNFLKKTKTLEVHPPVKGDVLPIEQVPDPTFAQKLIGDGIAWKPTVGDVVAPVNGSIVMLQDSLHAIGIRTEDGIEILLHIGLDTVELKEEGFRAHAQVHQKVTCGDPLITFDKEMIEGKGYDTMVILVVMENDHIQRILKKDGDIPLIIQYK